MLDLSPTKLLIIFVVAVVLLGPKRLPTLARQLGAGWRRLRDLHTQIDKEIRQAIPDLPSSQDIVRFARSPVTLLNQLADAPGGPRDTLVEDRAAPHPLVRPDGPGPDGNGPGAPVPADGAWPADPAAGSAAGPGATGAGAWWAVGAPTGPADDPSLN